MMKLATSRFLNGQRMGVISAALTMALTLLASGNAHAVKVKETKGKNPTATIETSEGNISVLLFRDRAPKTVENFIGLATGKKEWTDPKTDKKTKKPLYSGTVFHRVIPDFMIQGGDPKGNGTGGPGYKFEDETSSSDSFDKPGILAMANAGPNTNGSQFFITVKPTPWLNGRHTIFGEVTKGMDIVEKISKAKTLPGDQPEKPITIKKIVIK
jgi:peptidyl-prolyl cis-trans isomerase A (cyclophilin A)